MHILDNPVGLELLKIIATKLERKKIIWEFILTKAQEIQSQYNIVNAEVTKLASHDPTIKGTANAALIKGEFYKAKNFLRLLLQPNDPNSYDINAFISGTADISTTINTMYSTSDMWPKNAEQLEARIADIPIIHGEVFLITHLNLLKYMKT